MTVPRPRLSTPAIRLTRLALALALAALSRVALGSTPVPPDSLNAWQLIATARAATVDLGRQLGTHQGVGASLRPLLATFGAKLDRVDARFRARDPQVFVDLEGGSRLLGELRIRWSQSGIADPAAARGLRSLSITYRRLRAVYGREGLRYRQGPPLTEAERQHFERLQQENLIFIARLQSLRQQAARRGDRARTAEIDRFLAASDRIAEAEPDLASYLNTTMSNDEMAGEWTAAADDLRKLDAAGWGDADEAVAQLYVESDIGHVFQLDLGKSQDWSYLDQPTEIDLGDAGDGDRPKTQVFRLAGKGPDGTVRFEPESADPASSKGAPRNDPGVAASGSSPADGVADGSAARPGETGKEPLDPEEGPLATEEGPPAAASVDLGQAWDLFRALSRLWIWPLGSERGAPHPLG